MIPGQKVFGELSPNQSVTLLVDGTQGMKFGVKCKACKGTSLRLDVALADPDGVPPSARRARGRATSHIRSPGRRPA